MLKKHSCSGVPPVGSGEKFSKKKMSEESLSRLLSFILILKEIDQAQSKVNTVNND